MAFTTLPTVWVATKGSCQTPSPEPAKEPASTRDHQSCAKHQEARARGAPEGCEPVVGPCVRCPETIEKGPAPNQCRTSKRGHGRAKEQEDANRLETAKSVCLRAHREPARCLRWRSLTDRGPEGFRTFGTRADAAEMVVGVDACGMTVGKGNLNGVVAYLRRGFGARLGLVHGQHGRSGYSRCGRLEGFFLAALVTAGGAGTFIAQIGEIVVTRVAVGPGDVHASAARHVNLYAGRLFSWIEGSGHGGSLPWPVLRS